MKARYRARQFVNWLTLGTPLGLVLAKASGCSVAAGPRGIRVAVGYRRRFPVAAAFTVGSVVIVRDTRTAGNRAVMSHEERHASQWALAGGVIGFPIVYGLASAWSLLRAGDHFSYNIFERLAGLEDGGYPARSRARPIRTPGAR